MYSHSYTSPADSEQIPVPALSLALCYCVFMFMQAQPRCRGNKIMAIFSIGDLSIVIALLTISDLSIQTENVGGLYAESDIITLSNCDAWSFIVHTDEKRQTYQNSDCIKCRKLFFMHIYTVTIKHNLHCAQHLGSWSP